MRNSISVRATLLPVILALLCVPIAPFAFGSYSSAATSSTIALTRDLSGVALQDSLNSSLSQDQLQSQTGSWTFGGHYDTYHIDFVNQEWSYSENGVNQPVKASFSEGGTGLTIGIQAVSNNDYTGFYAASQPVDSELFHAKVSSSYGSIPSGFLQIGLYVRAAYGNTNYVTCADVSSSAGAQWEVLHGTGTQTEATHFDYLWVDTAPNQSGSNDCTIVTNGNNYLAVYLGQTLVYRNNNLALGIQKPFEAFLGVETTYAGERFSGTWSNFYSTQSGQVGIVNLPAQAVNASVVSSSGALLASSQVINGSTTIDLTKFVFPVNSTLQIYDSTGKEIAATPTPVLLMGGDVYTAKTTLKQQVASVIGMGPTLVYFVVPVAAIALLAVALYGISKRRRANQIDDGN